MKLSEIVVNYRIENDISQRELSRRCGVSHGLISLIEKGTNPQTGKEMTPDFDTYKKLADGMGISLQSLFEKIGDSGSVLIPESEDQKILFAYNRANDCIKLAVKKLLDIK